MSQRRQFRPKQGGQSRPGSQHGPPKRPQSTQKQSSTEARVAREGFLSVHQQQEHQHQTVGDFGPFGTNGYPSLQLPSLDIRRSKSPGRRQDRTVLPMAQAKINLNRTSVKHQDIEGSRIPDRLNSVDVPSRPPAQVVKLLSTRQETNPRQGTPVVLKNRPVPEKRRPSREELEAPRNKRAKINIEPEIVFSDYRDSSVEHIPMPQGETRSSPQAVYDIPAQSLQRQATASQDSDGSTVGRKLTMGQAFSEYRMLHKDRIVKQEDKWSQCSMEEWIAGGNELFGKCVNLLEKVESGVQKKMESLNDLLAKLDHHQKNVLDNRDADLNNAKKGIMASGGTLARIRNS